jgi:tryptophanyl-tRNA synthetase
MQDDYDCLFMLVDMHSITVRQDPQELRARCYDFIALYMACGIDPAKSTIFVQSHVPAHAELAWVLNCYTYMGELNRMTQFKDKSKKHEQNINAGLFAYPVLMAADILLYQADCVPVGADQKQHLELTRDLAQRFNEVYGTTFTVPEAFIPPTGARIMSLQEPENKMSKSDENPRNYVALLDSPNEARNKIKRAVTDSQSDVVYDESRAGLANLIRIYSALTGDAVDAIENRYAGKGYAEFKGDLADIVADFLVPLQARYKTIREDKKTLDDILALGAENASRRAQRTLAKVHKKLGFIPRARPADSA